MVLAGWAERARYEGSPEHKSYPSFAGQPKLRSDATRCPKHLKDAEELTSWLREAIRRGQVNHYSVESGFPKYVWVYRDATWFEARLVNAEQGTYKGYPLANGEAPKGLQLRGGHDGA